MKKVEKKMEKREKTLKTLSLFLIIGIMVILIAGVGGVRGEDESEKYNKLTGETLPPGTNDPNAVDLPEGFKGKTEQGMTYESSTNSVCDEKSCNRRAKEDLNAGSYGKGSLETQEPDEKESGGAVLAKADAAFQAALQAIQSVATLMGPLKDVLSNGQGQTTSNSGASSTDLGLSGGAQAAYLNQQADLLGGENGLCNYEDKQVCKNITKTICEDAAGNSVNATGNNSASGSNKNCRKETSEECSTEKVCNAVNTIGEYLKMRALGQGSLGVTNDPQNTGVYLSQNNANSQASTSIQEKGRVLSSSVNLNVNVSGQANIQTPEQTKTDVTLKGSQGSPNPYIEGSDSGSLGSSSVTGKAIASTAGSGQFVKIIEHDLGFGGEQIDIETLKSLNDVRANGANLGLKDGETIIEFNKQKTYYNREIKETPYFMNKITNENDEENYFRLLQGGSNGNYLVDDKKRTTVGDAVINHPDATMKGIVIAKERQAMFEKGLMAKR